MATRRRSLLLLAISVMAVLVMQVPLTAGAGSSWQDEYAARAERSQTVRENRVTQEEREAAAERLKLMQAAVAANPPSGVRAAATMTPLPGGVPDYFGTWANWAFSPRITKFVDGLPGLGAENANNLGQYIPVGHPDTLTYPGSDYYEIELREYTEKMHSELPSTTLRGYVQVNKGTNGAGTSNTVDPDPIHYLGPTILATKDRPVRIKFTNKLATGTAGDLFIPVDTTVMGAGMGPLGEAGGLYTENRGDLHLHGGRTVWISDGTPHQWITPVSENTPYPEGVSVRNVPDMPDPGDGSVTLFYSNQQSARMMFYHDHSFGITRLNVYAGEAAGYLISDEVEQSLLDRSLIPTEQIPLVIQDKTFVDTSTVRLTDPTWNWGTGDPDVNGVRPPVQGDLWYPHVYLPAQNPADPSGMNPTGRWHYGPWFWPPTTNLTHPPIANPYYDPIGAPWEPALMPATPNPSMVGESWFDTPIVNGTAYPALDVDPKAYRFRILNAANDRFWNLQLYVADSTTQSAEGALNTEVKMVDAALGNPTFPETWPTDAREGGVPDPTLAGPDWIQIGTEGGFLPAPAVIPPQPITWNLDPTTFTFGNVDQHSLVLASAERADVIVDFSEYAGQTLILYNDAPAAFPAPDARNDYYTGAPDRTDTGGAPSTPVGYGPNTRTIMQIRVGTSTPEPAFDLAALEAAFASTPTTPGVFASSQPPIIVPEARYDSAYATSFPADPFPRIYTFDATYTTAAGKTVHFTYENKAIQDEMGEAFDPEYGRMAGKLGVELPNAAANNQDFVLNGYIDPPTESLTVYGTPLSEVLEDGTQIWKITHNGVDTHPIHFHMFDVQLMGRVGWDNAVMPPDDNELGWKDTLRVNPLQDTIVAVRPVVPASPFGVPDSVRPHNPAEPIGSTMGFTNRDPLTGQPIVPPITNQMFNFGAEYVWHCHILSHEEMDMMRPIAAAVPRALPRQASVLADRITDGVALTWTDPTPWNGVAPTSTLGDPTNEIGFRIERATVDSVGNTGAYTVIKEALANQTSYTDASALAGVTYRYRVVAYNAAGSTVSNVADVGKTPIRAAGADRYATAVQSAILAYPGWVGVTDVIVASGENQVDALSAAGFAGTYDAPLLLTRASSLPAVTADAIAAMPDGVKVHIVGGTGAVSVTVQNALAAVPGVASVDRAGGTDRYATAAAVATMMKAKLGSSFPTHTIIVNGSNTSNLFDALTAGPVSYKTHYPLLLVTTTTVPPSTSNAITTLGLTRRFIVGGTGVVSPAVATALSVAPGDRISGANRYATAVAFAIRAHSETWLAPVAVGISATTVDALSGSAAMGNFGGPMLLTATSVLPAETQAYLVANKATIMNAYIFGGTGAVTNTVLNSVKVAIQ